MERGKHRTLVASLAGGLWMLLIVGLSFAAEEAPPPAGSEPPKVEAPASAPATPTAAAPAPKIDKGDTAWMLTSAALVLHDDNSGALFVLWWIGSRKKCPRDHHAKFYHRRPYHYTMGTVWLQPSFGPDIGGLIGGLDWVGLNGVGAEPNADYAATIPHQAFMIYQMMFAIITPALITGAFAERAKFSTFIVFILLWATLIYNPLGPLGMGGQRLDERNGCPRFCRWHRGSYKLRRLCFGCSPNVRQAGGVWQRTYAAS